MPSMVSSVWVKDGGGQSSWGVSDLQESRDDIGLCRVKGQPVHLHRQVSGFPAPHAITHQRGQEDLLLDRQISISI